MNTNELKKEGERMSHCVGGYGPACERGTSMILKFPNSTVEINPKTLYVFQHRGFGNSQLPSEDIQLLKQWRELNAEFQKVNDPDAYYHDEDG